MTSSPKPQHLLNEFLQAELHHTMGAYGVATAEHERVRDLVARSAHAVIQLDDVESSLRTNARLRDGSWDAGSVGDGLRHPPPGRDYSADGRRSTRWLATPIAEFYETAIEAIAASVDDGPYADDDGAQPPIVLDDLSEDECLRRLGSRLGITKDTQRRGRLAGPSGNTQRAAERRSRQCKLERMMARLDVVLTNLAPSDKRSPPRACARSILTGHLRQACRADDDPPATETPLHRSVLSALVEGHLRMHQAEHELSGTFAETFTGGGRLDPGIQQHLRTSIVLQTFAYSAARSVPWMFAENAAERDSVIAHYGELCDSLRPTYCMWVAQQVSLLALHRRGFSYWLAGYWKEAYRDFYKLKRLIRQISRVVQGSVSSPPGTREFLDGLYAIAEHHTGRIYQAEHAHDVALRHFKQAGARLHRLEPEAGSADQAEAARTRAMLHNSRWRVRLLLAQGRTYHELGRTKRSLLCHVDAWRCFLQLSDTELRAESNLAVVDEVRHWLERVVDDPELNKVELTHRVEPLVNQFLTIAKSTRLRWLAAEIMLGLGHALVMLKLPAEDHDQPDGTGGSPQQRKSDRLPYLTLSQAAELDNRSTAIGADLRRIQHRNQDEYAKHFGRQRAAPDLLPIGEQWPGGGSQFEEAARVVEYVFQLWVAVLAGDDDSDDEARKIAKALLPAFLTHTDSSNVRLAQVYRYLMQKPTPPPELRDDGPAIEFLCARRYSSFFPFLPRPSAFRVRGGGYFARIVDPGLEDEAERLGMPTDQRRSTFGIAIDPGPDFLGNLYRCGYSLADIDMVIVTHDHADHIASLDALLALLGYRAMLGDERFTPHSKGKVLLPIVGNDSVVARYEFFNRTTRSDAVCVVNFDDFANPADAAQCVQANLRRVLRPPSMRVEHFPAVEHEDASGNPAVGFMLSVEGAAGTASFGLTGDTGWDAAGPWPGDADVVVAHISGVPLRDLRELAGLDRAPVPAAGDVAQLERVADEIDSFQALWAQARDAEHAGDDSRPSTAFILERLQFGFRSRALNPEDPLAVSPLSPVAEIRDTRNKHLYLTGLLALAKRLEERGSGLLLVGELREELGTFRTRLAHELNEKLFGEPATRTCSALTADIGLKVKIEPGHDVEVLCSTCDLDNDLTVGEQYHAPAAIHEVCVKGEHEGVFYNCTHHNPQSQAEPMFLERVERYDVFGH